MVFTMQRPCEVAPASAVAAELGMTVNPILIAKSRVLSHLRRNADVLVN